MIDADQRNKTCRVTEKQQAQRVEVWCCHTVTVRFLKSTRAQSRLVFCLSHRIIITAQRKREVEEERRH